jgi:hypothetical protein
MTVDLRIVLAVAGAAVFIGGIIIGLLLHSSPQNSSGASVNLAALIEWGRGKKTYFGLVLVALNNFAARKGWIDHDLANELNLALGTFTAVAVTAKLNRIEQKTEQAVVASKIAAVTRPKEGP